MALPGMATYLACMNHDPDLQTPRPCPICRVAMQTMHIEEGVIHCCARCGV